MIGRAWWFVAIVVPLASAGDLGRADAPLREPDDIATRSGEDWAAFLGPGGNGRSGLASIRLPWPAGGPPLVWQCDMGEGYCAPAVAAGRAFVLDRVGGEIRLRCLHAETGAAIWEKRHATDYVDTFGYDGGPRAAPVVAGGSVITYGPEGRLECRDIVDGTSRWAVDTAAAYHVVRNFFGVGASPLVVDADGGRLVVVQVGGSRPESAPPSPERLDLVRGLDSGLVAFDLATGRERWRATDELASYSTPVVAAIEGRPRIVAWMRDRLVVVDPADGTVAGRFRWRSDELFSANAASPVVHRGRVLLSECYGPGSVLLDLAGGGVAEVRRDRGRRPHDSLRSHWATPILHEGHLYGVSGRNAGDARLVCVDWETGAVAWSEGGFGRASITLVAGHLVVLGEFGDLAVVKADPERYVEVSRVEAAGTRGADGGQLLAAPCWAAPVVARGLLYVRGRGRLACLDLGGDP